MKKIMFNDKYGLTQAVLEGRKTQTRRIAYDFRKHTSNKVTKCVILPSGSITYMDGKIQVLDDMPLPAYKIGEVISVAQSYSDVIKGFHEKKHNQGYFFDAVEDRAGWKNKMFTKAYLMPHRIKITNVRVERLQDISEEDCLKEGIDEDKRYSFGKTNDHYSFDTPREAFASLIDKTCGRGTWDSNPYVFVYDFELIK